MSPDPRRVPSLIAGLLAVAAAAVGLAAHDDLAVVVSGVAGLAAGLLGWLSLPGRPAREAPLPRAVLDLAAPGPAPAQARPVVEEAPLEIQALVDPVTGLHTESYLLVALEARIAAARRRLRPISFVLLEVVEGLREGRTCVGDPVGVADAVRCTLREADTSGRLADGRFALVLEDTNESGAVWTIERLRKSLAVLRPGSTIWAGVACYPAHGFTVGEILDGAEAALVLAREWRQDRIEVATVE